MAIPPGFAPVAPLNEHQRQQELDWVETGLRRTYLDGYAGRHVVDHRFVVLHVCRDLGLIVMSTRQRASFGTRVCAQPAQFSLPELETAVVRLRREHEELVKTEPVTGWWIDIEANSVVVYVREDVDGARLRLQDRYGPMITTEYGVATVCRATLSHIRHGISHASCSGDPSLRWSTRPR